MSSTCRDYERVRTVVRVRDIRVAEGPGRTSVFTDSNLATVDRFISVATRVETRVTNITLYYSV